MLNLFYSNKLEALAAQLSAQLAQQPLPPLVAETIMVESSAMAQWLTEQMTCQLGIAANLKFPFPAALVWNIYRQQMPDLPKSSGFDRAVLVWRLYSAFFHAELDNIGELSRYLKGLNNARQLLGFAEHIADLFDQYQIYRPDWLLAWQQGEDMHWQAQLWRWLCQQTPMEDPNRADVFARSLQAMPMPADLIQPICRRLHVFAVASLPQAYLQLFAALAETIEVNVFVLNPCAMFWGNLQPEKTRIRQADLFSNGNNTQNELLALMAKQSRDYIALLQQQAQLNEFDCYVKVAQNNLLAHLQNDILTLRQPAVDEVKTVIDATDRSIQLHSCHSPQREVQVLHDQLLQRLAQDPQLQLEEIAIMVPDLETYAPFFHAVFATAQASMALPYHLAERRNFEDQAVKRSLIQLLKLPAQQYKRTEVQSLLQEPVIHNAFAIDDLALVQQLLEDLQVRFGFSDASWQQFGEGVVSFSWQQARARLLASFQQAETEPGIEHLTVSGIYNDTADQAGRLCYFIDQVGKLRSPTSMASMASVAGWCDYIEWVLGTFYRLDDDDSRFQVREIRTVLEKLREQETLAALQQPVSLEIFLQVFEVQLQQASQSHYFQKGVINIATLLPMRFLPFKVVCLLGMNDGEFPRPGKTDGIDMMLQHPRQGDRNRREEDRALFLDAILAARQCCYISYIGRSHIDNSERYPSLLVKELLAHLEASYTSDTTGTLQQQLLTEHYLQAFDSRYFSAAEKTFSFNPHLYRQALKLQQGAQVPAEFAAVLAAQKPDAISIQRLAQGLASPLQAYLGRLQVQADWEELKDDSLETFSSDGLQQYQLLDVLFQRLLQDAPLPDVRACCRAGLVPQTRLGEKLYQEKLQLAQQLLEQAQALHLDLGCERRSVQVLVDGMEISGELDQCNAACTQRLAVLANRLHGKHVIKAWINHLFACATLAKPLTSYLLTAEQICWLQPLDAATASALLQQWCNEYQQNLQQPSWFFPRSAWAYMQALAGGDESKAEKALYLELQGGHNKPGEWQQADAGYAFRGQQADVEKIRAEAQRLLHPLLEYFAVMEAES